MRVKSFLALTVAVTIFGIAGEAQVRARGRVVHSNASGGTTAVTGAAGAGGNGGAYARGRRVTTDGAGNARVTSGTAVRTSSGATAVRAGQTNVSSDGGVSHNSGFAASGSKGSIQSTGSAQRNADGSASGERTTNATAENGNTYSGETTWTKGEGVQHTGTCKDASGNVISCR